MNKTTRKSIIQSVLCIMLAVCMVVCGMTVSEPGTVQAAAKKSVNAGSGYKMLFNSMSGAEFPVKTGKYYVKQKYVKTKNDFDVKVYVSTKRNGGYKKIPYCDTYFITTNGRYAYYTNSSSKKQKLYKYTYSTRKAECVATLPSDKNYQVMYAYGYSVILKNGSASISGEGNESLYEYNLKTNKLRTLWNKANRVYRISAVAGKYVMIYGYNSNGKGNSEDLLCEMTSDGLKIVKKLRNVYGTVDYTTVYDDGKNPYAASLAVNKNKVYYMKRSGARKVIIYEYNAETSKIKRIASMNFADRDLSQSEYAIVKFTSKYCIYRYDWNTCRKVTYATGKTVRVKNIDIMY